MCTCNGGNENAAHFFFHCLNYVNEMLLFFLNEIRNFHPLNLDTLLNVADHLTNEENLSIFKAIQMYIIMLNKYIVLYILKILAAEN